MITILVDQNNVEVGETIEVTLNATGFDQFDFFDLNLNFDTALFSFIPLSFSSDLPTLAMAWDQVSNGVAISFLDFFPSSGDFVLGQFELTAISTGVSNFSLVVNEFALSDPIDIFAPPTIVNAEVSGQVSASVPEPSALSVMLIGLLLLISNGLKGRVKNSPSS